MPSVKDQILDSFEDILIKEGERAATVEAVAAAAGVSKGGLLYHYRSKEAMVDGLCRRMVELCSADRERILAAPEGAARYYVRTSLYLDSPLDRALVATARLVQQGHPGARRAFAEAQALWLDSLEEALGSRSLARAVKLMGDGLYYGATFFSAEAGLSQVSTEELDDLLRQVDVLVDGSTSGSGAQQSR